MGSEWSRRAVAELVAHDLLAIGDGYRAKNSEFSDDGLPFARARNLRNGFDFADADRLPFSLRETQRDRCSLIGDVVITSKGTVGRVGLVTERIAPFVYSPQLCYWRSRHPQHLLPRFLYYWFFGRESRNQLATLKGQTDMADYVSLRDQLEMVITLPPSDDQREIAGVLGALDDKIESNRRLTANLTDLLRVVYDETVRGARKTLTLGDLGTVIGGGTPRSSVAEYWEPREVAWVTPKDMTALDGVPCVWHGERWISRAGLDASSAKLVPPGSVLYTSRATLGLVAIAQRELATNQGFITLVPKDDLSSTFLYSTLRARSDAIRAKANGATFLEVNKTNFKQVECPMPDAERLAFHDSIANPTVKMIAELTRESRNLTAIRDALLPKLVTGQIRVPLSEDPEEMVGAAVDALDGAGAASSAAK